MLGLLIKDFMAIRRQGKIMLFLLAFYLILGLTANNNDFVGTMVLVICMLLPITTIAYDEKANWDKYALSLPVSRQAIVLSKYLFGIILSLLSIALLIAFTALSASLSPEINFIKEILVAVAKGASGLILLAIILPILFKFGVEKGRLIMMAVFFIPTIIIALAAKFGLSLPNPSLEFIKLVLYASPLLIILLLAASYAISLRIYRHKEF